jgi:hypothetical protein
VFSDTNTWQYLQDLRMTSVSAGLCSRLCVSFLFTPRRQLNTWTVVVLTSAKFKLQQNKKYWASPFIRYAVRVVSKESRRLALPRTSYCTCFLLNSYLSRVSSNLIGDFFIFFECYVAKMATILSRVGWYAWRQWRVLVRMIGFISTLVTISLNHI